MNAIKERMKFCAQTPFWYAVAVTVVLTIGAFILLSAADSIFQKEMPVTLLSFGFFIGSAASWKIAKSSQAPATKKTP